MNHFVLFEGYVEDTDEWEYYIMEEDCDYIWDRLGREIDIVGVLFNYHNIRLKKEWKDVVLYVLHDYGYETMYTHEGNIIAYEKTEHTPMYIELI